MARAGKPPRLGRRAGRNQDRRVPERWRGRACGAQSARVTAQSGVLTPLPRGANMRNVKSSRWFALAFGLALGCAGGPKSHPLAPGILWAGKWDTNFQEMTLHQQGKRVWGVVNYHEGSLDGTVDGDVMRFKWTQREN